MENIYENEVKVITKTRNNNKVKKELKKVF